MQGSKVAERASNLVKSGVNPMVAGKKPDPYELDFNALHKEYVQQSNKKLPFVKSSFMHYTECPVALNIEY